MRQEVGFTFANVVIALVLFVAGCAHTGNQAIRPGDYEGKIRVACVGDSITYGASIKERSKHNYPVVLGHLLGGKFETANFGVNGATLLKKGDLPHWKTAAFKKATDFNPQVVVIKLGTNDSKPHNWKHHAEYMADLESMIDHFRGLPSKPKIWVCLPVPVYQDRWGINKKTVAGEVIPMIRTVTSKMKAPTIDLHSALSGRPELFPDKIHPNGDGARLMAETIRDALLGR